MAVLRRPSDGAARPALRRGMMLSALLLTAGCSGPMSLDSIGSGIATSLDGIFAPFSGPTNIVQSDALTVQRVRGRNPEVEPLTPEPGNVWPEGEAPRPTLMSGPDEAMRNIPSYAPSLIEGAPPARSPVPTPSRRGSSGPPPGPAALTDPMRSPASSPPPLSPPGAPLEGRAMVDPAGRPAIGTGGTPRVRGFTQPGIGGGAVVRDGNVETWIGPDGRTSTRIVTD